MGLWDNGTKRATGGFRDSGRIYFLGQWDHSHGTMGLNGQPGVFAIQDESIFWDNGTMGQVEKQPIYNELVRLVAHNTTKSHLISSIIACYGVDDYYNIINLILIFTISPLYRGHYIGAIV